MVVHGTDTEGRKDSQSLPLPSIEMDLFLPKPNNFQHPRLLIMLLSLSITTGGLANDPSRLMA